MKKILFVLFVSIFVASCAHRLEIVKNWEKIIKKREIEKKDRMVATVGSVLYQKHIDNVDRYNCFTNKEPIYYPTRLTEDLDLEGGYFVPAGKIFCDIWTYDCNSNEFYLRIEKRIKRSPLESHWCYIEDSIVAWESSVFLVINLEKKGDFTSVRYSNKLVLIESTARHRSVEKEYELPTPIELIPTTKDTINYNIYLLELIFGGVQNNDLIIYSREYLFNEPNQSHSLIFYYNVDDVKQQKKIKYKDIVFEIMEFDRQSITYRIVR